MSSRRSRGLPCISKYCFSASSNGTCFLKLSKDCNHVTTICSHLFPNPSHSLALNILLSSLIFMHKKHSICLISISLSNNRQVVLSKSNNIISIQRSTIKTGGRNNFIISAARFFDSTRFVNCSLLRSEPHRPSGISFKEGSLRDARSAI